MYHTPPFWCPGLPGLRPQGPTTRKGPRGFNLIHRKKKKKIMLNFCVVLRWWGGLGLSWKATVMAKCMTCLSLLSSEWFAVFQVFTWELWHEWTCVYLKHVFAKMFWEKKGESEAQIRKNQREKLQQESRLLPSSNYSRPLAHTWPSWWKEITGITDKLFLTLTLLFKWVTTDAFDLLLGKVALWELLNNTGRMFHTLVLQIQVIGDRTWQPL